MFSLVGIVALVFFIFVRPQELFPSLQVVPWIYIFFGMAVFGLAVDLRLRLVRPEASPQLKWVCLFFAWCILNAALKSQQMITDILIIVILFVWYYLISHGLAGLRALRGLALVLVGLSLYLAVVGVHQYLSATSCIATVGQENGLPAETGTPDGRPCQDAEECYRNQPEPGMEYLCEKVGLFETTSITGRVRYVGVLRDPNDLALTLGVSLPLLVPLFSVGRGKGRRRFGWAGGLAAAMLFCIYVTRSRGGMLVTAAAAAIYFLRRYRIRGLIISAAFGMALMVAAAGSRQSDAAESSNQRINHMYEGMTMFKYAPLTGVGTNQFVEHHWQTAHNAYVLTLAEQGLIGFLLWIGILYTTAKIPLLAYLRYRKDRERRDIREWAIALLASLAGMSVGIFFLSFTYHYVLWCYKGMSGALYRAVRLHDPEWKVSFKAIDGFAVILLAVGMVGGLYVLTRVLIST